MEYRIYRCSRYAVASTDLRAIAEADSDVEYAHVELYADSFSPALAEGADAVFIPSVGRIGIAWGADADWADVDSLESGVELWAHDSEGFAARN